MTDQRETADLITQFLSARVPVVVLRSIERSRALEVISAAAGSLRSMPFFAYSSATGLYDLVNQSPLSDDHSFTAAVDYATSTFRSRPRANFVFIDVEGLDSETPNSRHFVEVARIAEQHEGSIIFLTSDPVWSGLTRLGMSATLGLPTEDELQYQVRGLIDEHRSVFQIDWQEPEIRRAAEMLQGVTLTEAVNIITTMLTRQKLHNDDLALISQYKDQIFGALAGLERIKLKESDYEVGGLESLRGWLSEREELMKADLSHTTLHPPRGVLLCGVPGCGKSLSAKAIATEWRLPLYRLDMASVLGMYVGESESRLREALETSERVAPCILWIDEIEKGLAGMNDSSGVTKRLVGQFLFWLQESDSKVFVVATANEVTALPPELLRKGRFDEIFFVDLPTPEEREQIIRLYFNKHLKTEPNPYLLSDLVELSEGFAGSDLEAVIHDIAAGMFRTNSLTPPADDIIKEMFENVLPFSKSNPDDVAAIRAWGRERAVPAAKESAVAAAPAPGGIRTRRVVPI